MSIVSELRELVAELESRPLIEEPRRRRLPKAASSFLRRKIEGCKADGKTIRHCVTLAYRKAQRKGLL